jgi:hypothetical protein
MKNFKVLFKNIKGKKKFDQEILQFNEKINSNHTLISFDYDKFNDYSQEADHLIEYIDELRFNSNIGHKKQRLNIELEFFSNLKKTRLEFNSKLQNYHSSLTQNNQIMSPKHTSENSSKIIEQNASTKTNNSKKNGANNNETSVNTKRSTSLTLKKDSIAAKVTDRLYKKNPKITTDSAPKKITSKLTVTQRKRANRLKVSNTTRALSKIPIIKINNEALDKSNLNATQPEINILDSGRNPNETYEIKDEDIDADSKNVTYSQSMSTISYCSCSKCEHANSKPNNNKQEVIFNCDCKKDDLNETIKNNKHKSRSQTDINSLDEALNYKLKFNNNFRSKSASSISSCIHLNNKTSPIQQIQKISDNDEGDLSNLNSNSGNFLFLHFFDLIHFVHVTSFSL